MLHSFISSDGFKFQLRCSYTCESSQKLLVTQLELDALLKSAPLSWGHIQGLHPPLPLHEWETRQ